MEFKYKKKTYIYDPITGVVKTKKGNPACNQEDIAKAVRNYLTAVEGKGFNFGMNYQQFEAYIAVLTSEQREELFHHIYSAYLYVNEWIGSKGVSQAGFHKGMAKIKRYEQYLYRILIS